MNKIFVDTQRFKLIQLFLRICRIFIVVSDILVICRDHLIEQHCHIPVADNIVCPGGPHIVHGSHAVPAAFIVVNDDIMKCYPSVFVRGQKQHQFFFCIVPFPSHNLEPLGLFLIGAGGVVGYPLIVLGQIVILSRGCILPGNDVFHIEPVNAGAWCVSVVHVIADIYDSVFRACIRGGSDAGKCGCRKNVKEHHQRQQPGHQSGTALVHHVDLPFITRVESLGLIGTGTAALQSVIPPRPA